MKNLGYVLLTLSFVLFVMGALSRLMAWEPIRGLAPGTYWKGAMGLAIYAIAGKLVCGDGRRSA